jgi:hypothetical protein
VVHIAVAQNSDPWSSLRSAAGTRRGTPAHGT